MVLPALSLSQAELARAAPIIAHVGSDMGPKSKESELRGGTLKMLDEVCLRCKRTAFPLCRPQLPCGA